MLDQPLPIELPGGADTELRLTYRDPFRQPVNLTGCVAYAQVKKPDLSETFDELTSLNGRIVLDGPAGGIAPQFPHAVTSGYTFTEAVFDVLLVFPNGSRVRLQKQALSRNPGVTQVD